MALREARISLLPLPRRAVPGEGVFRLSAATAVGVAAGDAEAARVADHLARAIEAACGWRPRVAAAAPVGAIELTRLPPFAAGDEAYELSVAPAGVRLAAASGAGLFYAVQTLAQLLPRRHVTAAPAVEIPCVRIDDAPRFPWRGLHLDVSRHFLPVWFVKKFIDALAVHKMNVFHWHLTDDQGWRLEIRKYPRLTEVGAWRRSSSLLRAPGEGRYGGFYTQAEVREIVAFAAERYVQIVPEIEMPGHSQAAIAAYPHLGTSAEDVEVANRMGGSPHVYNVEESTFAFLQDVLDEVLDLFPSRYIHVGGDEADKTQWRASRRVQERRQAVGAADEDALQGYFLTRIEAFLHSRGRRLIGWDEILDGGAPPRATVMAWRGARGGIAAAQRGHDVVMTPDTHCYLDHYQGDAQIEPAALGPALRLQQVYAFDPIVPEISGGAVARVLGGQGNLWTEFVESPAHAEYMAYPRACALAEVLWSPSEARAWPDFVSRLEDHTARLDRLGIEWSRSAYQVLFACSALADPDTFRVQLANELGETELRYTLDGSDPEASSTLYPEPFLARAPLAIRAAVFAGDARVGPVTPLHLVGCWRDSIDAARFDRAVRAITVNAALDPGDTAERPLVVGFVGARVVFDRVDLNGVTAIAAEVGLAPGHTRGGAIEVRLGARQGPLLARLAVPEAAAQGYVSIEAPLEPRQGVHALHVCFTNDALAADDLVALLATLRLRRAA